MTTYRALGALALAQSLAVAVVLVAVDGDWQPPAALAPGLPSAPNAPAGITAGADLVVDVAARPLFVATRRPLEARGDGASGNGESPDALADVALVGVYGTGDDAGVLLRKGTEVSRLHVGGDWLGWRLQTLGTTEVTLIAVDGATRTLKLERQPQMGGMTARPTQGAGNAKASGGAKRRAPHGAAAEDTAGGRSGDLNGRRAELREALERAARVNSSD